MKRKEQPVVNQANQAKQHYSETLEQLINKGRMDHDLAVGELLLKPFLRSRCGCSNTKTLSLKSLQPEVK